MELKVLNCVEHFIFYCYRSGKKKKPYWSSEAAAAAAVQTEISSVLGRGSSTHTDEETKNYKIVQQLSNRGCWKVLHKCSPFMQTIRKKMLLLFNFNKQLGPVFLVSTFPLLYLILYKKNNWS